jgi:hypothetical protein
VAGAVHELAQARCAHAAEPHLQLQAVCCISQADAVRTVLIVSGTFYFAVGEQWDESKLKAFPAGTLYSEPPRTPHYAWAKDGEVILQVTAIGPTGNVPVAQIR